MKRLFIRLLHLLLEFVFHLSVKLYFPFSFGKTNYLFKIICPLLFVFYSNLSSIQLSKIFEPLGSGRSGWTRTIDLALIRRAL